MGCGSWVVGSPIVRGPVCGVVAFGATALLWEDCAKSAAEKRDTKPKRRKKLEINVISVLRKIQGQC
jgi:hypothetical protein